MKKNKLKNPTTSNKCGTTAGYSWHYQVGEFACEACTEVKNIRRREIYNPVKDKNYKLQKTYGITLEEYNKILDSQNGVCYLCKKHEKKLHKKTGKPVYLSVDHDHSCCPGQKTCGKCTRGLLCNNCNTLIGNLEAYLDIEYNQETIPNLLRYIGG